MILRIWIYTEICVTYHPAIGQFLVGKHCKYSMCAVCIGMFSFQPIFYLVSVEADLAECSATKEIATGLNEPMRPTLDEALEYVVEDELVEVKPMLHIGLLACTSDQHDTIVNSE